VPPPTSTARRAKLQHEVFPSTDAGDAHAGPSEDAAAQHEGAAGERAPRRSGRHRTPSRRLADAVAYAAGRQHGALIAPKRAADGQPPSADEGRPKKSRRLTAQLHLRGVPQQPCCQYITCLQIAAVRTWTQACMSKCRVFLQPDSRTLSLPITGTQAAPSHVATAARTCVPLPPTPKSAHDLSLAGRDSLLPRRHRRRGSLQPRRRSPGQSYAPTLCSSFASSAC